MVQMSGPIPFRIGQHGRRCRVSVSVPTVQDQDWEGTPIDILPRDPDDLPADELRVVVAFNLRRLAHDGECRPTWESSRP